MRTRTASLLLASLTSLLLVACGDSGSGSGSGAGGSTGQAGGPSTGPGNPAGTGGAGTGGAGTGGAGTGGTGTGAAGGGGSGPGACPVLPADNPWNADISNAKVDPLSDQYMASIGLLGVVHPDFGTIYGIPYQNVDGSVAKSPVIFDYPDESDPGPYPIPANPLIEQGSDAHMLMIHTGECKLYEIFAANKQADGWHGGSGAIFDLKSNALRPEHWTSADAAGLPIYPGLARYDETTGPGIKHALRFTVQKSQKAYVHPATHAAGSTVAAGVPPMGLRVRLKAAFDTSVLSPQAKLVAEALKKYGMFVADNGSNWYISGAPDAKWDDNDLHNLNLVHGSDFEALETGPLTPQ